MYCVFSNFPLHIFAVSSDAIVHATLPLQGHRL